MKKKKIRSILSVILCVALLLPQVAIPVSADAPLFRVTFHGNGGYFDEGPTITEYVYEGEKALAPVPEPVKDAEGDTRYSFRGWYTDGEGAMEYDFDSPVASELDLYARWDAEADDDSIPTFPNSSYRDDGAFSDDSTPSVAELVYEVTFCGNGGYWMDPDDQSVIEYVYQEVNEGDTISPPETDPVRDVEDGKYYYLFSGWYRDAEGKNEYDFEAEVTADFILYAGWNETEIEINEANSWYLSNPNAETFYISNGAGLRYLAQLVNGQAPDGEEGYLPAVDFAGRTIELTEDIELTGEWIPIGTNSNRFRGTFDGQNHTAGSLTIGSEESPASGNYQGLFGYAENTAIQNLTAECAVYSKSQYIGGIIGYLNGGSLKNLSVSGTVNTTSTNSDLGGITGYANNGTIEGCRTAGTVLISGRNRVGGIAGYANNGTVEGCQTSGAVTISGNTYVGGIAGQGSGQFAACETASTVTVTGTGTSATGCVGGIIGNVDLVSSIERCINRAEVTSLGGRVGGIVGALGKSGTASKLNTINFSANHGDITGDNQRVGGIAGHLESYSRITAGCNTGNIKGTSSAVGGIVGRNQGNCTQTGCFNCGIITGVSQVGAIAGLNFSNNTSCYYLEGTIDNPVDAGNAEARTAEEFKDIQMAYDLNKDLASGTHNGSWSWAPGNDYPIFADEDHGAVYKITLAEGMENGTVSTAEYVIAGTTVAPEIDPEDGYILQQLMVEKDGGATDVYSGGVISFPMPRSDIAIDAVFVYVGDATEFTLAFNANGGHFAGSSTDDIVCTISLGEKVSPPTPDPQRDPDEYTGYTFAGWYRDPTEPEEYNFDVIVTENVTLYAKWEAIDQVIVRFNVNLDHPTVLIAGPPDQGEYRGHKITDPRFLAESEGKIHTAAYTYTLQGWSIEAEAGELWDFDTDIIAVDYNTEEPLTLYARWVKEPRATFAGEGSETDPYQINDAEDLNNLRKSVMEGIDYTEKYFRLTTNIDLDTLTLDEGEIWSPIGSDTNSFKGNFNGDGNTISNLAIDSTSNYQGLFGYLEGGAIENLTVTGNVAGDRYTGGIAGYALNTVFDNCVFGAEEEASSVSATGNEVGGIVGYLAGNGTISNSDNKGTVKGGQYVGGIVGYFAGSGIITDSSNKSAVEGSRYVGGIAGQLVENTGGAIDITYCHNNGGIRATISANSYAAGIVGSVTATGTYDIKHCYNLGTIDGLRAYVGGIAGQVQGEMTIENCYNYGTRQVAQNRVADSAAIARGVSAGVGNYYRTGCVVNRTNGQPLTGFNDSTNSIGMDTADFAGGEVAHLLNIAAGAGIWAQHTEGENGYPVFADAENKAVYKVDLGQAVSGGSVTSSSGQYARVGEEVTLTVTTDEGYLLSKLLVYKSDGELLAGYSGGGVECLTFTIPEIGIREIIVGFVELASLADNYTLIFDANGGSFDPADENDGIRNVEVTADHDYKIPADRIPEDPIREEETEPGVTRDYTFAGWYIDTGYSEKFVPEGIIGHLANIAEGNTLHIYAKWIEETAYTVTFDANGGAFADGSTVITRQIEGGHLAEEPAEPGREDEDINYAFDGWYTDKVGGSLYDFSTPVNSVFTLYTHWLQENVVIVTFDLGYRGADPGDVPEQQEVEHGNTISAPEDFTIGETIHNTESIRRTFKGWYAEDSEGELKPWDFNTKLDNTYPPRMTLYAQWEVESLLQPGTIGINSGNVKLLDDIAELSGAGEKFAGYTLELTSDIELDSHWQGIGTEGAPFNGTFLGQDYTLVLENCGNALFNYLGADGEVSNLNLSGSATPARDRFGPVAGENDGTISQITVDVDFSSNDHDYVGGVVGYNTGEVSDCTNEGEIRGRDHVGGVMGYTSRGVSDCANEGEIRGRDHVGGVLGSGAFTGEKTLDNLQNSGTVDASGRIYSGGSDNLDGLFGHAGGVIGSASGRETLTISNCINTVNLNMDGPLRVGGIIGYIEYIDVETEVEVEDCANEGDITLTNQYKSYIVSRYNDGVGGIVGLLGLLDDIRSINVTITNCTNTGKIDGGDATGVGGIFGYIAYHDDNRSEVILKDCGNEGDISGASDVGGLAGWAMGIENSFNTGDIRLEGVGVSYVGGLVAFFKFKSTDKVYEVVKSYNTGNVTGIFAGGLIGRTDQIANNEGKRLGSVLIRDSYSPGSITATNSASGVLGRAFVGTKIQNSYWYGEEINAPTTGGIAGNSNNLTVENSYYYNGLEEDQEEGEGPAAATIIDPNEGADGKDAAAFRSGEVAYLLDGGLPLDAEPGEEGQPERRFIWTQGIQEGYPIHGEPPYYMATIKAVDDEGFEINRVFATINGRNTNVAYFPAGAAVTVAISEDIVYMGNIKYKFAGFTPNGEGSLTFTMGEENAEVPALFTPVKLESIEIITPPDKTTYNVGDALDLDGLVVEGTYSDGFTEKLSITRGHISGFDSSEEEKDQVVTVTYQDKTDTFTVDIVSVSDPKGSRSKKSKSGNGGGIGTGSGDGMGSGNGISDGVGTGTGGVTGDGASAGQGSASEQTTSQQTVAPTTGGKEVMEDLVIARQDEVTAVEENTGEMEDDEGGSPAGGSEGEEDEESEEVQLTVFEIVRNVVKENPLMTLLVLAAIAGIMLSAGYRRYSRQKEHI
ncbi:MAG: InlB B-repeat-containing protein [Dehalobacterium sp.]